MFYKVMDLGKKAKASLWEILRCLFHAAVIAFLLSYMIFQAILCRDHLEMKQRLAEIERATPKTLFTTSQPQAAGSDKLDADDLHVRLRRAVTISLQSLEKQLKVLETR